MGHGGREQGVCRKQGKAWAVYITAHAKDYMSHRIGYINWSFFSFGDSMKYLAFLAFVQVAIGAAVTRSSAKDITLNIANANIAPDGFTRSMLPFLFGIA